jgi:hypothetical protein
VQHGVDVLRALAEHLDAPTSPARFCERGDDGMVEVLSELEADELLHIQVVETLRSSLT